MGIAPQTYKMDVPYINQMVLTHVKDTFTPKAVKDMNIQTSFVN
jgi:hypothetical protein